ncbi:malto-oligosyltrehalose trehalohydrolase [Flavisolibacter nicotianae]|uniref:malto-oligosyltrehalose trehalohydrolase n=1 Tax=Flavisolibacter nicotianae TaxID=2364882 RepID=UPI000EAFF706|nr:malto-oligosyltrehalose trehalohydrolase [Flavisolibacter nicotianae]
MEPIAISKRTVGVNFRDDGRAEIRLWAPLAEQVAILSGETTIALEKEDPGYWITVTDRLHEGSRYRIRIDDRNPFPDPTSLSQPDGVHGPSEAVDLTGFQWQQNGWTNLPLEDYIIYELHTGTFTSEGTFASLEEKLDHLKELGVTAIELMPVAQFPGSRNWGYDGVYPFAVQNSYGGPHGLQHLVDACHQKGLAVILDVVYNHLGPEGNYFGELGPFFTRKYHTPWGSAVNFDDRWCDGVRRMVVENALMWCRDFHIDALRIDAAHAIRDFSAVHILKELRLRLDELMQKTGKKYYLIVEQDLNDTRYIDPLHNGGYGMDAQWIDEFHHALRVTTGQAQTGYYEDFNGIEDLARAYRDAYVYTGQWSPHRKRFFGTTTENCAGKQFVVFSQNHDHIGNRMLGERTGRLLSFEMQKLVAAAVLLSPYLPLLFMGEEWGETQPFLYFVSHSDEALAEAVRTGRKKEFAAFHTEGEPPDPMADDTFHQSRLHWHLMTDEKHDAMLAFYKALIQLRKRERALRTLNRKALAVDVNSENQVLVLHRWTADSKVICLLNFSTEQRLHSLDRTSEWQALLCSAGSEWGGPGCIQSSGHGITLQPQSVSVFKR